MSEQKDIEAWRLVKETGSYSEAARRLGVPTSTVWDRAKRGEEIMGEVQREGTVERKETAEGDQLFTSNDPRIRGIDDLVQLYNIDTNVWEPYKETANYWTMGEHENYQFKARFRRAIPDYAEKSYERFIERAKRHMPKYEPVKYEPIENPHMLVFSLPDPHFGMLAWEEECGDNYDSDIASALYEQASIELLRRAQGFPIDQIVIEMGGDIFHMNDNTALTPAHKNKLDTDGRLPKVFDKAMLTYRRCIDQLRTVAPVEVKWVPGNHDPISSYYLATNIDTWYRNDTCVNVDRSPFPRKYYSYGQNLIGLTHGNEEKWRDLTNIMAGEASQEWGRSTYREWHLGHLHTKKKMFVQIGDELGAGVYIRSIPSLAAKDAWHVLKGYKSMRAGEAFIYHKDIGPVGEFTVNIIGGVVQKV